MKFKDMELKHKQLIDLMVQALEFYGDIHFSHDKFIDVYRYQSQATLKTIQIQAETFKRIRDKYFEELVKAYMYFIYQGPKMNKPHEDIAIHALDRVRKYNQGLLKPTPANAESYFIKLSWQYLENQFDIARGYSEAIKDDRLRKLSSKITSSPMGGKVEFHLYADIQQEVSIQTFNHLLYRPLDERHSEYESPYTKQPTLLQTILLNTPEKKEAHKELSELILSYMRVELKDKNIKLQHTWDARKQYLEIHGERLAYEQSLRDYWKGDSDIHPPKKTNGR